MKTYPIVEITFSPTGGTKKVADQISCYLGNITNTVNLIRHDVSFSDVTVPSDSLERDTREPCKLCSYCRIWKSRI